MAANRIWIDVESSGLDPEAGVLLEVATRLMGVSQRRLAALASLCLHEAPTDTSMTMK